MYLMEFAYFRKNNKIEQSFNLWGSFGTNFHGFVRIHEFIWINPYEIIQTLISENAPHDVKHNQFLRRQKQLTKEKLFMSADCTNFSILSALKELCLS